jgi:N-acetylneuraminate synthase
LVDRSRELERALGSADKLVTANEKDTSVVQRRCLRTARDLKAGEIITREMVDVLRPATPGAIKPAELALVIGTRVLNDMPTGKEIRWTDLGE